MRLAPRYYSNYCGLEHQTLVQLGMAIQDSHAAPFSGMWDSQACFALADA